MRRDHLLAVAKATRRFLPIDRMIQQFCHNCQYRGCGRRRPARMSAAYGNETDDRYESWECVISPDWHTFAAIEVRDLSSKRSQSELIFRDGCIVELHCAAPRRFVGVVQQRQQ
jgi:hypothetical protein